MFESIAARGALAPIWREAPLAMALIRNGRFAIVNTSCARLFGFTAPSDAKGKLVGGCVPGSGQPLPLSGPHELTAHRQDGTQFPVRVEERITELEGETALVAYYTDLTSERCAEEERQRRLRSLEAVNRVSRLLESDLDIQTVLERLLAELVALFACDRVVLVYPADPDVDELSIPFQASRAGYGPMPKTFPMAPAARDAIRDALAAGRPLAYGSKDPLVSTCLLSDDPSAHMKSMVMLTIRPRIGKPWAFELQDITEERTWTEEELRLFHDIGARVTDALSNMMLHQDLRLARDRLAAIIENIEDAVVVSRPDGRLEFANERAARLFGFAASADLVARGATRFDEVVSVFSADGTSLSLDETPPARARREGKPVEAIVKVQRRGDTQRRIVSVRSVPLADEAGAAGPILTSGHDITELMHAEQEVRTSAERLRQAQKMEAIGRLAGGVAHDFNNLLTLINAYARLAIERLAEGDHETLATELAEIARAGERAAALTTQLLAFSRKQVLDARELDLNDVVRGMERMLRTLLGEGIELELDLDPQAQPVHVDSAQLEQVILNLATNARDAMAPEGGGRLTLRTRPGDRTTSLIVSDDGEGMSETVRTNAFEPFFTTKPVGQRTGLGLASVYGIVTQSGGTVHLDSTPGVGTTFTIALPVAKTASSTKPIERGPLRTDAAAGTVLVVEDEPGVRRLVAKVLARLGFRVLEASDGQEALEVLGRNETPVRLVVTDIVMPNMNGRELAQQLREKAPDVRVLFMTGYADGALDETLLAPGSMLLHKPFEPAALASAVERLLGGDGSSVKQ